MIENGTHPGIAENEEVRREKLRCMHCNESFFLGDLHNCNTKLASKLSVLEEKVTALQGEIADRLIEVVQETLTKALKTYEADCVKPLETRLIDVNIALRLQEDAIAKLKQTVAAQAAAIIQSQIQTLHYVNACEAQAARILALEHRAIADISLSIVVQKLTDRVARLELNALNKP